MNARKGDGWEVHRTEVLTTVRELREDFQSIQAGLHGQNIKLARLEGLLDAPGARLRVGRVPVVEAAKWLGWILALSLGAARECSRYDGHPALPPPPPVLEDGGG